MVAVKNAKLLMKGLVVKASVPLIESQKVLGNTLLVTGRSLMHYVSGTAVLDILNRYGMLCGHPNSILCHGTWRLNERSVLGLLALVNLTAGGRWLTVGV